MMDLIERYVKEVGRKLPRSQRADVQAELRSLLEDMVEDRAQTKVDRADEELVAELLVEFGSPEAVAASYQSRPQYLIGPDFFPILKLVVSIVAAVLGGLTIVGALLATQGSEAFMLDLLERLVKAIPSYIGSMINAFAIIVVIMAILERVVPEKHRDKDEAWDPRDLPQLDEKEQVNRAGLLIGSVFISLALIVLNFFPAWAGVIYSNGESWQAIPLMSQNFRENLLPWLNLSLLATLLFNLFMLWQNRSTRLGRLLDVGNTLLSLVVIYIFLTNGPILGIDPALLAAQGRPVNSSMVDTFESLIGLLNTLLRVGLFIGLIATGVDLAKKTYGLVRDINSGSAAPLAGKPG